MSLEDDDFGNVPALILARELISVGKGESFPRASIYKEAADMIEHLYWGL